MRDAFDDPEYLFEVKHGALLAWPWRAQAELVSRRKGDVYKPSLRSRIPLHVSSYLKVSPPSRPAPTNTMGMDACSARGISVSALPTSLRERGSSRAGPRRSLEPAVSTRSRFRGSWNSVEANPMRFSGFLLCRMESDAPVPCVLASLR